PKTDLIRNRRHKCHNRTEFTVAILVMDRARSCLYGARRCLYCLRQGSAIISGELGKALARQLMLNVEALPRLVESELLIEDRLSGCGVLEIATGHRKAVARPILQNLCRHRR